MESPPNMDDYRRARSEFSLPVPERFSFPLDVVDPWSGKLALVWTDGVVEQRFTFNDLKELSSLCAGGLRKRGIRQADKVMVMLPNIPAWWEVMLALMRLNAIPIPSTTLLTSKDIEYRLSATDIRTIIATEEEMPKIRTALESAFIKPLTVSPVIINAGDGCRSLREGATPVEGNRAPSGEAALIYFTSGTTGPPKMVLHTQASYPLAHWITGAFWLDLRPGDIHWNLSDTGWAKAAWSSLFGPWHRGAAVFSYYKRGRFDPLLALDILQRFPVTTFCGPPTAYRMMVKEAPPDRSFTFAAARHFVAAGEPLNREIILAWKDKTGHFIYDGYGQTETVNCLANFRCMLVKPGSMGLPVPGFVVDVVDDGGNVLPAGVEGEIAILTEPERPVGLFREYLGNPAATAKTMRGRWYVTGDRAYKDDDGYFWFVGRTDDIILTSGYRIGPFEIESILIGHPAVRETAVVASPDEIRGEVVKAFVVLTSGHAPSDTLVAELQEHVKARTAPYKYPRKIEFVDDLPKTVSGKIKRRELKMKEFGRA